MQWLANVPGHGRPIPDSIEQLIVREPQWLGLPEGRLPMRSFRPVALLYASAWWICACPSAGGAQQPDSLSNSAYKNELLAAIATLLETKYVLPEEAARFAEEFRSRGAAGLYDSYQDAAEFAAKVTADLVAITNDSHISLRVVESSDLAANAASSCVIPYGLLSWGIANISASTSSSGSTETSAIST